MRSQILFCLFFILLILTSCSETEDTTFLESPIDTLQYEIPYSPTVDNIFVHDDSSKWDLSIAFPQTLHVIYHYKKGNPHPADTTELSDIINSLEFNLFFIKDHNVYIIDKSNHILKVKIKTKRVDTLFLPDYPDYEKVEYWRAYEVQNIMYQDSCALFTPYFIFHLNGRFTEDSARSWNYRSYSGYYFAKLCLLKNDSIQVDLLLENIRNRYIAWNEIAPKVPKYDIGPEHILIPSTYHNWIYLIDPEQWKVRDSLKVVSAFADQPIKRPTINFEKRFDTEPYTGPNVRWAREFRNSSGQLQYLIGIDWPAQKGNAYLIQVYNANFDLEQERILEGNYRYISYAFLKDHKLYVPIDSEEQLLYEVYRLDD